jgi:glycolate oxidase iron-sulfur subunit
MASTAPRTSHEGTGRHGRSLLDDCVHCGFCLPTCPTWVSWGEEMDSPRGRIDLMRGLADGRIAWSDAVASHFDRCLGCMACLTSCPSGVRYDVLIEETRARRESQHPRGALDGLYRAVLFAVLPYPARLRALAALLLVFSKTGLQRFARFTRLVKLLPGRLAELEALAPPIDFGQLRDRIPPRVEAVGPRRARVGLLTGCVQGAFFPGVNAATLRVLAAEGCEVLAPAQGCCGALSLHAGREEESRDFARRLIESFEKAGPLDAILTNAAGCGSALKDCRRVFAEDPAWASRAAAFSAKVRDVTEFLAGLPPVAARHPVNARIAYHDACHLAHAQGVREPPRALLRGIPGVELVEIPDGDQCCGSAGIYNMVEPESAREIGNRKVENVLKTRADLLASANLGCTLQVGKLLRERGMALAAAHPIEILDASIAGRPLGAAR